MRKNGTLRANSPPTSASWYVALPWSRSSSSLRTVRWPRWAPTSMIVSGRKPFLRRLQIAFHIAVDPLGGLAHCRERGDTFAECQGPDKADVMFDGYSGQASALGDTIGRRQQTNSR